jgi:hypothetical protein
VKDVRDFSAPRLLSKNPLTANPLTATGGHMRAVLPVLLTLLLCSQSLYAQEQLAVVRKDGLLAILPEVGGPRTYGTYVVPKALGYESVDRFVYLGNPLQINFLPPSELPGNFGRMNEKQKLQQFFRTEAQYLSSSSGRKVSFTGLKHSRVGGVEYLAGRTTLFAPDGSRLDLRLKARTAGRGILHAGYFVVNSRNTSKAQLMTDNLLRSFRLVKRPLTQQELEAISKAAK